MKSTILGGFVPCRVMVSNLKELRHVQWLFESLGYRTGVFKVSYLPDCIVTYSDSRGECISRSAFDSYSPVWTVEALEDYVKLQLKQRDQKQNLAVLNGESAVKNCKATETFGTWFTGYAKSLGLPADDIWFKRHCEAAWVACEETDF